MSRRGILNFARRAALGLCALPALVLAPAQAQEPLQSLRYGATLFHYYQQDYFNALTELLVGQQLSELGEHDDEARLLHGGMALSYGMRQRAQNLFEAHLADAGDGVDRDMAWFYLGKLAWQRDDAPGAMYSLSRIAPDYSGGARQEADFLRASIELYGGNDATARALLDSLDEASAWRYYLAYNLGARHAARGEWGESYRFFASFVDWQADTDETRDLQDRGLTAAAYTLLSAGAPAEAQGIFRQVRLDSAASERALLGYGWSSAQQGDYLAALSPWQTLAQRSILDQNVRESLLAVPYAYAQLGSDSGALQQYRNAAGLFDGALSGLQRAIEAIRTEPMTQLLGLPGDSGGEWLFTADLPPRGEYAAYFEHLASRHEFQVAQRELLDLYSIAGHLQRADSRIEVLRGVDAHQQRVWAEITRGERRAALGEKQQRLLQQFEQLRSRTLQAIAAGDHRALGDSEGQARWARLERADATAAATGAGANHTERLRLLRGLLLWQDNEAFPARAWEARRSLQALEQEVAQSAVALRRVDEAIALKSQSDFSPRIDAIAARIAAQQAQVTDTIALAETDLRQLAVTELEQQAEQLSRALAQSELAIARLYDRARGAQP